MQSTRRIVINSQMMVTISLVESEIDDSIVDIKLFQANAFALRLLKNAVQNMMFTP